MTEAGKTTLDSGEPTPRNHDGIGAFEGSAGGTVLVNNHEIGDPWGADLPVPHLDGLVYDPVAAGGATIAETDREGHRIREHVGLAGTSTNCAGRRHPVANVAELRGDRDLGRPERCHQRPQLRLRGRPAQSAEQS